MRKKIIEKRKGRIYLVNASTDMYLTKRELDCARHIIKGKTIAATAQEVGLSTRTVEFYINKMKKRFGANKKHELIGRLIELGVLKELYG